MWKDVRTCPDHKGSERWTSLVRLEDTECCLVSLTDLSYGLELGSELMCLSQAADTSTLSAGTLLCRQMYIYNPTILTLPK